MLKIGKGRARVRKNADGAVRLSEVSGLRPGDHLRDPLLVPVCGPEIAVIHGKGEPAGPAGQTRKLPASDDGIGKCAGTACEVLALTERQGEQPIGIDLVGSIEIRDSAAS